MPYRQFIIPRDIFYGPGALESLNTIAAQRVLIVTDRGVRAIGLLERVEKILQAKKAEVRVFDSTEPDPSKTTVWSIFGLAKDFQPDLFIGLGGGSSMDAGKGGWALYEHPDLSTRPMLETQRELPRRIMRQKARFVAIPTTSGTGSEVTRVAVITDHDEKPPYKVAWFSNQLVPDVAIVDPELTLSMPPAVTANTGFDALVHAVECYVLTPPSDLVDSLAIWSARTIWEWLPKAMADGKNLEARDKMHTASLQAGIAFNNGRLGLVHGTAHQIGAALGVPHGRANAFMLCPVFAFLYPNFKARLSSLATLLGISGKDDPIRVTGLLTSLDALKSRIGIPTAIKDSELRSETFMAQLDPITDSYINHLGPAVVQMAPEARRAAGTPASAAEVKELFLHAWNGTWAEIK